MTGFNFNAILELTEPDQTSTANAATHADPHANSAEASIALQGPCVGIVMPQGSSLTTEPGIIAQLVADPAGSRRAMPPASAHNLPDHINL
jgi:hypothetical protein